MAQWACWDLPEIRRSPDPPPWGGILKADRRSLVTMARKRGHGGRKRRPLQPIPFQVQFSLGALVNDVVISSDMLPSVFTEDFWCSSVYATWAIRGLTPTEGPISVGLAHNDYTVTEIAEATDVTLTGPGSKIEQERSRRLVRKVGTFRGLESNEILKNGVDIRTGMKFTIEDGKMIEVWAQNRSAATLTTGAVVEVEGVAYGRWLV